MLTAFFGSPLLAAHVGASLIGIMTGLVAVPTLASGRWLGGWHAAFLASTIATSLSGFLFPVGGFTPALGVGAISLLALAAALLSLRKRQAGRLPGAVYAASATLVLYINLFVLVAQLFQKVPALRVLAPTQSEPPFLIAQSALFAASVLLAWFASRVRPAHTSIGVAGDRS